MGKFKLDHARVQHIFDFMEYDHITDNQHNLVVSYEEQYEARGYLSEGQFKVLESIFDQAAGNVEWSR